MSVKSESFCGRIDQVEVKGSETISNLTYPVTDSKKELIDYKRAIRKKMKKVLAYKQRGFDTIALFMIPDSLPTPITNIKRLLSSFDEAQEGYTDQYIFLYFCYPCALLFYDFKTREHRITKIDRHVYDELRKRARIHVEQTCDVSNARIP